MASWDVFCSVVDNYGDIGVTWRLTRQLALEHGQRVRLWVDDQHALARICPETDPNALSQVHSGVEIRHWAGDWRATEVADVVIEAFACTLPEPYVAAMCERSIAPLWLNLEYLSAESWVDSCHALPSLQPNGLQKFFYFPGFRPSTGGLLRESGLIERRDAFQADPAAQARFLATLGVQAQSGERLVSLFAYEMAALPTWLDAVAGALSPTLLLVPEGRVLGDVARWAGRGLQVGDTFVRDALRVQVLPFVRQEDYDHLLWCCNINAVRGEDSFVRAQWAGRPFIWHIYRQDDDAHLDKLEAFLALQGEALDEPLRSTLRDFWLAWNGRGDLGESWKRLDGMLPQWSAQISNWQRRLSEQTDLAAGLVRFYTNWL